MRKESFEALVQKMMGKDTTRGWDIVMSYDEDELNNLLKVYPIAEWSEFPRFTGTGLVEDNEGAVVERKYDFDLEFQAPTLQFDGRYGKAQLSFGVGGKYQQISPRSLPQKSLPAEYRAMFSVNLFNVAGTFHHENGSESFTWSSSGEDSSRLGPNNAANISPTEGTGRGICLSFKHSDVTVTGGLTELRVRLPSSVIEALKQGLAARVQRGISDHFIAGVTGYVADPDMIVIRPTLFCFTVTPRDEVDGSSGVLSMWIEVEGGSQNGQRPSGNASLLFQIDGEDCSPIPDQSSASIIFSHDCMAKVFFQPEFSRWLDNLEVTSVIGTAGMSFSGKLKSGNVNIPQTKFKEGGASDWDEWTFQGIEFSTSTSLTNITFDPSVVSSTDNTVSISYKSQEQISHWSRCAYGSWETTIPRPNLYGTAKATFSWKAKGRWEGGSDSHPNVLQILFTPDQKWSVNPSTVPHWIDRLFNESCQPTPAYYQNLEVPAPCPDLKMRKLDYFLATNLLLPGRHLFHAHDPAGSADKTKGLAVPRDFILTGNIRGDAEQFD